VANYFLTGNTGLMGRWAKRSVATIFIGIVATLITACGGGGVSTPPPAAGTITLSVLPGTTEAFGDVAITLSISGGRPGYTAVSSNPSILPIANNVSGDGKLIVTPKSPTTDTTVTITARDTAGATATATVTVKASTINTSVVITPNAAGAQCTGICSGGDGTVTVQSIAGGIPSAGRSVRFDAFQGDYDFVTPGSGALVNSITVPTDSFGNARVLIRARNAAPSQSATLQITDVSSGQVRRVVFSISQLTTTDAIRVIPSTFSWTSSFRDRCVINGVTNHYIYGGTPPYDITNTSPDFATVAPNRVLREGGAVVVTTGDGTTCSSTGSSFVVRDATGRTTTFTVSNSTGPTTGPSFNAGFVVSPPDVTPSTLGPLSCGGSASAFVDQVLPSGITSLPLTATSLEPNRVSALIADNRLTVTRLANGIGGVSSLVVRVSNSISFRDIPVSLAGAAPFGCGTNAGSTPISVGASASVSVAAGVLAPQTITGGTGPYTITSSSSTIAQVSADGATFSSTVIVAGSSATFVVRGVSAGVTFVTVTDSGGSSTVIVVTVTGAIASLTITGAGAQSAVVPVSATRSFTITGGLAPYTASVPSCAQIISAAVTSGNILTITVGSVAIPAPPPQTCTVTISDAASPPAITVVNVTNS
jgi:hypothetical protein